MRAFILLSLVVGCHGESALVIGQAGVAETGALTDEGWDSAEPESDSADTAEDDVCEDASDEAVTWYLSADDSNSKAQAALVRALIEDGGYVGAGLRPYEFLNYYSFDYTPAEAGSVAIDAQARLSTVDEHSYELLVGVVAPAIEPEDRDPANFTFSIDTSGSMDGEPLDLVKATLRAISVSLTAGDVVSIVRWDSEQRVVMASHEIVGPGDPTFIGAISGLDSGGSTDLSGGLERAYQLAEDNYDAGRLNRVILMSDGGANTGVTDEDLIGGRAEDQEGEGIYMMGIGCSQPQGYSDYLMDRVTDIGKGAYLFMDSEAEAERQFTGENFVINTQIAAYDVRLEMDLPAGFVIEKFHGEQMSTNPDEVREQHLAPNDSMLYNLVLHDCDPDSRDGSETFAFRVTWSDLSEDHVEEASFTLAEMMAGENRELTKAQAILSYVDGLVNAAEATDNATARLMLDEASAEVTDALTALGSDEELDEILTLIETYKDRF